MLDLSSDSGDSSNSSDNDSYDDELDDQIIATYLDDNSVDDDDDYIMIPGPSDIMINPDESINTTTNANDDDTNNDINTTNNANYVNINDDINTATDMTVAMKSRNDAIKAEQTKADLEIANVLREKRLY